MDTGDLNTNEHIHPAEGHDMPPAPDIDMETSPDATVSGTVEIPPDTQTIENADTAERQTAAQDTDTIHAPPHPPTKKKRKKSGFFKKARFVKSWADVSHSPFWI